MNDDRLVPFVSVIIPVFNDTERLRACLAALTQQTYPSDRFEVIVIDNGSTIPVELGDDYVGVRLLREPRPGVNRARATGVESARGSLLAFTDADCLPDTHWIREGVACFERTPNCGVVAGHVTMYDDGAPPPTVATMLSVATHLRQEQFVRGHWAALANVFTSRAVLNHVGTLNPAYLSSGETEWCARVHAAGYQIVYAARAEVRHPARATTASLLKRAVRFEYAWRQLRREAHIGRGVRFWIGQHLVWPLQGLRRNVWNQSSRTSFEKMQMSALTLLLMTVRVGAWAMLSAGVKYDVRARWG